VLGDRHGSGPSDTVRDWLSDEVNMLGSWSSSRCSAPVQLTTVSVAMAMVAGLFGCSSDGPASITVCDIDGDGLMDVFLSGDGYGFVHPARRDSGAAASRGAPGEPVGVGCTSGSIHGMKKGADGRLRCAITCLRANVGF
jgi:hypothetical protein